MSICQREIMATYTMKIEPGRYDYSGSDIQLVLNRALESVGLEKRIPKDMKSAVKDYVKEVLNEVKDLTTDLIIHIPDSLSEYGEVIAEIIRNSFG